MITSILTPLTSGPPYVVRWVTLRDLFKESPPILGGLKGHMAPGDAHPYLALFGWNITETKPRFFLVASLLFFLNCTNIPEVNSGIFAFCLIQTEKLTKYYKNAKIIQSNLVYGHKREFPG